MKYDDYMKAIDVRDNLLTTKIIENKQVNFFAIVKRNESITNLDFRNNECYTDDFRFNLSQIMLKYKIFGSDARSDSKRNAP